MVTHCNREPEGSCYWRKKSSGQGYKENSQPGEETEATRVYHSVGYSVIMQQGEPCLGSMSPAAALRPAAVSCPGG